MSVPVNYLIRTVSQTGIQQQFFVSLQNSFWTGPFQVGVAYRNGGVAGNFTFFQGNSQILTMTLGNNEVYLFEDGVGSCANAAGEQGSCELIRQ